MGGNINTIPFKFTNEQTQFIKENYENMGADKIGELLQIPRDKVKRKAEKLKLKLSKNTLFLISSNGHKHRIRRYKVNEEQFLNIQTPEVAYILGLLWADGYINKGVNTINLEVKSDDGIIYQKILETVGKWNLFIRKPRKSTWSEHYHFCTSNSKLAAFLAEHDYRSKDASPDKILSKIPYRLKHYWFRGLVDGDGHLNVQESYKIYTFCICSCFCQKWDYMINCCNDLHIPYTIRYRNRVSEIGNQSRASLFHIISKTNIIKFCNYIYQNYETDNIGLPRKYDAFLKIKYYDSIGNQKPKYSGIGYVERLNKWRVYIPKSLSGKEDREYLGYYESEEEAFAAQQKRILEIKNKQ